MFGYFKEKISDKKKHIFEKNAFFWRIILTNGEMISKERYNFSHGTTNQCEVKIKYKKTKILNTKF